LNRVSESGAAPAASRPRSLALPGAGLLAACLFMLWLGPLRQHVPAFLAAAAAAGLCYLWAAWLVLSGRTTGSLRIVVAVALVCRLILFFSPPSLSDDIYRYHWDGRLLLSGVNPYRHAPAAPELAPYRDALWPGINHNDVPTIYPPLSQAAFALAETTGLGLAGHKLLYLAVDAATLWLLLRLLARRGLPPERTLLYAWSPLVLVEIAGSAHNDVLAVLLLLASLHLLERGREAPSVALLAASALAKLYPLCLLPVYFRHLRRKPRLLLVPVLALAAYLPFAGAGWGLFAGLAIYGQHWRFNDSLFWLLSALLPPLAARVAAALLLALTVAWVSLRETDPLRAAFFSLAALLLLSPTVHPWYLLWVAPFLCLYPSRAWLLLSVSVPLSYWILVGYVERGVWQESLAVKALIWLPFYALLAWDWRRSRQAAEARPATT
jgi:hypothetical protein